MSVCYKPCLMSTIMFDCKYEVYSDLLMTLRYLRFVLMANIFEGLVLVYLI